ncbi:hypothetical protein FUSO7_00370 [Fusobacterium necrophorum BFTR-2]|nr:hypothetical protein [Fusobacterium necrophorum]KDE74869.1 hypothetical protein FUSO7_00370 [Fusobacterium necrophorum BFTR-2]
MKANMDKVIEMVNRDLPAYYDMTFGQMNDIRDNSKGAFEMIITAFKFGFGQDMKYQKNNKGKVKK